MVSFQASAEVPELNVSLLLLLYLLLLSKEANQNILCKRTTYFASTAFILTGNSSNRLAIMNTPILSERHIIISTPFSMLIYTEELW